VLATAIFGIPEYVVDGKSGWLFEPQSVAAVEAALRSVLGLDVETRRSVAATASAVIHEHYDSAEYAGAISKLLHVLAGHPPAES
jgi:glycosyltransferase involved in cell wall biosynthesis